MADVYFSGQGTVYVATRDVNGNAVGFRDVGNVPALRVTLETDVLEHKESKTGNRLTDLRLTRERRARIAMTLESFSKANLMMLLYGTGATVVSGSASAEVFPSGLAAGDMVALAHTLIGPTGFSIVDSAGTPLTLTEGTNYKVDRTAGLVTMLTIPGTQPYKANYQYLAEDVIPMFRDSQTERFLRFSGLNTANASKSVVVELYRVVFDPVGTLDLINDEFAQFEIEGSVLYDSNRDTNDTSGVLGGFGRIILPSGS